MKVLAYCVHGTLSYSILRRVATELARRGADVRWEFAESNLFSTEASKRLAEADGLRVAGEAFAPDLALHADPRCAPRRGCRVVEVPHGLASKAGYYLPEARYEVDVHLAVSDWYADRLRAWHPHVKTVVTGMPKLDGFFEAPRTADRVLFAPTFGSVLSCWPHVAGTAALIGETEPSILRFHRVNVERDGLACPESLEPDSSLDICRSLARARVVVSDVSSAWLEAMALGIPVVCYVSPTAREHLRRRPQAVEGELMKWATVVGRPEDLRAALVVARPAPRHVQDQLLSYRGGASARAAEVILGL